MRFADRRQAGELLGRSLSELAPADPLVAALPRGGVPVGYEVAQVLGCGLDILVVRKVGFPGQPELAMGAVAEDGVVIRNTEVLALGRVAEESFERGVERARAELSTKVESLRGESPAHDIAGRTLIIVDDGLATGSTALAAVQAARSRGASEVWVAVPVAPPEAVALLSKEADRVIALHQPRRFMAVGAWYDDFAQTSDGEVRDLLQRAHEQG